MPTMTVSCINLDYLDTMTGGDADMRQEMLQMLKVEIPDELNKMTAAVAASDWEEVFQISHKFKTTLSFIGFDEMININKTVEYCSRNKVDLHEIAAMVKSLNSLSHDAMRELNALKN